MKEARVNGHLIPAGPDAPTEALCPACKGAVKLRKRRDGRNGAKRTTYFWRHVEGVNLSCTNRYTPFR